jgi:uncharacterized protein YkwD
MKLHPLFAFFWLVILVPIFFGCGSHAPAVQGDPSEDGQPSGEDKSASSRKEKRRNADLAGLSQEDKEILDLHNHYRSQHCAEPLVWSNRIARAATSWANKLQRAGCAFGHSNGTTYGENLFFTAPSSNTSGTQAVKAWYDENGSYHFSSSGFSGKTGHFTQVVWRETREVGCGKAQCNGGDIWVCNYSPPGNVETLYRENVRPRTCR